MLVDQRIVETLIPGNRFVELGCGNGIIISKIAHQYQESIGIDIVDRDLNSSQTNGNWKYIKADLNDSFPLDDSWANCIVANQVIEHVYNPFHFARESYRCLASGGRLVVTTPNIRYIKNLWWLLTSGYGPKTAGGNTLDGEWDDGHIHYFTHKDLFELFQNAGFAKVYSRALIDIDRPSLFRKILNKYSHHRSIGEFLSGNILLIADK